MNSYEGAMLATRGPKDAINRGDLENPGIAPMDMKAKNLARQADEMMIDLYSDWTLITCGLQEFQMTTWFQV